MSKRGIIPSNQVGRILTNIFQEPTGLEEIDGPHANEDQLIKFAMESLGIGEKHTVMHHVRRCRTCQERVQPLVDAYQAILALQRGESPETILRTILNSVVDIDLSKD